MILKHIIRSVKKNIGRTILVIVSIMISAAVILMNFIISSDIIEQYTSAQRGIYHDFDLMVKSDKLYFSLKDFKYDSSKINDVIKIQSYAIMDTNNDSRIYKLYGTDVKKAIEAHLVEIDSNIVPKTGEGIIDRETAEDWNLSLGDKIEYLTVDGSKQVTIAGIAENKGLFAASSSMPIIITNSDTLVTEFDLSEDGLSAILLDIKDEVHISDVINELQEDNEDLIVIDLINSNELENNIALVRMILLVILLVVILLNFYIISSNSKVILESRTFTLGTFRSIGATQSKVAGILMLENVIYGICGGLLGVVMGLLLRVPLVSAFTAQSDEIGLDFNGTTLIYIAITVIFAVLLQVLCTISHIIKQSTKSVRSILFDKVDVSLQHSMLRFIIGLALFVISIVTHYVNYNYNLMLSALGFVCIIIGTIMIIPMLLKYLTKFVSQVVVSKLSYPVQLGCKNLSFSKAACSNVILVTIALTIMLSIYMLSTSLCNLLESAADEFGCDIRITGMTDYAEHYDFLKDEDIIDEVTPIYYYSNAMDFRESKIPFVIVGTDVETQGIVNESGKKIGSLEDGEALIDSYYAMRLGISEGDKIELSNEELNAGSLKVEIVGFIKSDKFSTLRNVIVISENSYLEKITDVPAVLNVKINGTLDSAKVSIKKTLAQYDLTIQAVEEYIEYQESYTNSIIDMVWLILFLSALLSVVGIVNNMVLGFMQRKREYAVLNSIAMSKNDLLLMIISELVLCFLLSCIFAVAATSWLSVLLSDLMYSIGIYLSIEINSIEMLQIAGITFVLLMFTSIVPIRNLSKMVLIDEIKCD